MGLLQFNFVILMGYKFIITKLRPRLLSFDKILGPGPIQQLTKHYGVSLNRVKLIEMVI